jgi:TPR repeat protein
MSGLEIEIEIGDFYYEIKEYKKAEHYYQKSVKSGNNQLYLKLANMYYKYLPNDDLLEKNLLLAMEYKKENEGCELLFYEIYKQNHDNSIIVNEKLFNGKKEYYFIISKFKFLEFDYFDILIYFYMI